MEPNTSPSGAGEDLMRCLGKLQETLFRRLSERPKFLRRIYKPDRYDPELLKALGILYSQITDIRLLMDQKLMNQKIDSQAKIGVAVRQQLTDLLRDLERFSDSNSLPAAWELVSSLESVVLQIADKERIGTLLALELGLEERNPDSVDPWGFYGWGRIRWRNYFKPEELLQFHKVFSSGVVAEQAGVGNEPSQAEWSSLHDRAVERLLGLYRMRSEDGRLRVARFAMRKRLFLPLGIALFLVFLGLLISLLLISKVPPSLVVTSAFAGALGSTLSGVMNLRGLLRLTDLRLFQAGMYIQPVIGAAAGLFLFFVVSSGLVGLPLTAKQMTEWSVLATYGFIAGFSEPFLLGTVKRIAGAAEEKPKPPGA